MGNIIDKLLQSTEPSIQWITRVKILDEDQTSIRTKSIEK